MSFCLDLLLRLKRFLLMENANYAGISRPYETLCLGLLISELCSLGLSSHANSVTAVEATNSFHPYASFG